MIELDSKLAVVGVLLLGISVGGFFSAYHYLDKNKIVLDTGRGLLSPSPYSLEYLTKAQLKTASYSFIAATVILLILLIMGSVGAALLLIGIKRGRKTKRFIKLDSLKG